MSFLQHVLHRASADFLAVVLALRLLRIAICTFHGWIAGDRTLPKHASHRTTKPAPGTQHQLCPVCLRRHRIRILGASFHHSVMNPLVLSWRLRPGRGLYMVCIVSFPCSCIDALILTPIFQRHVSFQSQHVSHRGT